MFHIFTSLQRLWCHPSSAYSIGFLYIILLHIFHSALLVSLRCERRKNPLFLASKGNHFLLDLSCFAFEPKMSCAVCTPYFTLLWELRLYLLNHITLMKVVRKGDLIWLVDLGCDTVWHYRYTVFFIFFYSVEDDFLFHHGKKKLAIFLSPAGMSLTKISWTGIIKLFHNPR